MITMSSFPSLVTVTLSSTNGSKPVLVYRCQTVAFSTFRIRITIEFHANSKWGVMSIALYGVLFGLAVMLACRERTRLKHRRQSERRMRLLVRALWPVDSQPRLQELASCSACAPGIECQEVGPGDPSWMHAVRWPRSPSASRKAGDVRNARRTRIRRGAIQGELANLLQRLIQIKNLLVLISASLLQGSPARRRGYQAWPQHHWISGPRVKTTRAFSKRLRLPTTRSIPMASFGG